MENMCLQSLILKNEKSFYAFNHFKIFGANSTCELCYDTSTYKHDDMYFIFMYNKNGCSNFISAYPTTKTMIFGLKGLKKILSCRCTFQDDCNFHNKYLQGTKVLTSHALESLSSCFWKFGE